MKVPRRPLPGGISQIVQRPEKGTSQIVQRPEKGISQIVQRPEKGTWELLRSFHRPGGSQSRSYLFPES